MFLNLKFDNSIEFKFDFLWVRVLVDNEIAQSFELESVVDVSFFVDVPDFGVLLNDE